MAKVLSCGTFSSYLFSSFTKSMLIIMLKREKSTLIISTLKTSTDYRYHSDIVIEAKCQLETLNVWYFLTISYQLG